MKPHIAARLAPLLAVMMLGAATPATAAPHGGPPSCGDTITRSTRLTVDLVDCPKVGLVIRRDGITLDLNGHRVDGDSSGHGVGIDVEGHRDVTIENGTVREFSEGVFVRGGEDIAVRHVTSVGQGHGGILVDGARDVTIAENVVWRSGAGIIVTRAARVRIARNHVSGSTFGGIPVFDSRRVVIARNSVTRCRTDVGIGLLSGSSHAVVVRNLVSRNGAGIVAADGSASNLIAGNTVRRNDSGVVLDVGTSRNRVVKNVVGGSLFEGIAVVGSDGNLIARNRVAGNGRADPAGGIAVIPLPDDVSQTSDSNRIVRNAALANDGDGILIGGHETANFLRANRAYGNTQLGVDAAGAIDGGRNRAGRNGDQRQCVGVSCTP